MVADRSVRRSTQRNVDTAVRTLVQPASVQSLKNNFLKTLVLLLSEPLVLTALASVQLAPRTGLDAADI